MAERAPAAEARRRKLELRLHLGVDALLTAQELCDIFTIREADLLAWVKRLPVHIVAGKQHYRYGDVVKLSKVGEDRTSEDGDEQSPPRAATRGTLKRVELEPVVRRKKTG
jgi:hypothetical protein